MKTSFFVDFLKVSSWNISAKSEEKDTNPIKKNLNCSKYDLIKKNSCSAYKQLDPELNERKLHSLCGKMIAGFLNLQVSRVNLHRFITEKK